MHQGNIHDWHGSNWGCLQYKAEIPQSSTVVAVKKLWRSGSDIEVGSIDDHVGEVNL